MGILGRTAACGLLGVLLIASGPASQAVTPSESTTTPATDVTSSHAHWMKQPQAAGLLAQLTDAQADYCDDVYARLRALGVRVEKDVRNEKLNYKIREAQLMKVPYMLIVGDREKEDGTVTVRKKDGQNLPAMTSEAFCDLVRDECRLRTS